MPGMIDLVCSIVDSIILPIPPKVYYLDSIFQIHANKMIKSNY